jgi:sucrose-6-phosphate hydrolase SacC (GH32 family)
MLKRLDKLHNLFKSQQMKCYFFRPLFSILFLLLVNEMQSQSSKQLIAHWKFDERSGKVASEEITQQSDSIHYLFNTIPPFNDPVRRKGILNTALVFDGFSNWIQVPPDSFKTPLRAMTISVWVAPRAFENGDGGKLSAIVNQQDKSKKEGFVFGIFRHGSWSFQFGTGTQWIEIWNEGHLLPRRTWSYLVATFDSQTDKAALYLNGELITEKKLNQNSGIKSAMEPLVIGKNNHPEILGGRSKFELNMFNGFMDDLKIYNYSFSPLEVAASFHNYLANHRDTIPAISYEEIKIDRAQYKDDPYRPQYHAIPPGAWMNEPHAPFYYKGKYHLTYQHNPTGPYWHQIDWGHWVSNDLVHWYDEPEAIFPDSNSVAPDGIWSGSATFDDKGIPVYFYTFGDWSKVHSQGVALAHPKDPGDTNLTVWVKDKQSLIAQKDDQGLTGEFRDPFAWKDTTDNKWYVLVGSGIKDKGGTAWIYVSDDFHKWNLKGPFYLSDYAKYPFLGSIWELPVFLPIGKYANGETKYIMIISPKGYKQNVEVYYWLGKFDKKNYRFVPDNEEPQYWDYGVRKFIGPSGFIDPKTGRVLIFSIAAGGFGPGWAAGCASFPANIFLDKNGNLGVKPIDELKSLRKKELISLSNKTLQQANEAIKNINGDMLEIIVEMEASSEKYGIKVRRSPDNQEETGFIYDAKNQKLFADISRSSLRKNNAYTFNGTDTRAGVINHFDLKGEDLKLHIFLDKSLLQAYVNDMKTVTTWIYPTLGNSKGIELWSENGDAKVKSLRVWEMKSIYY